MSFTKLVQGIKNNWKKTVFGTAALSYLTKYTVDYYDTKKLMRKYCERALKFGREPIKPNENPLTITVILNPNANKRKATKDFEKYCAPILFLAGMCVDVLHTESEGHAKKLVETLGPTDAVIVAGGDGTLSEVITGLMRKSKTEKLDLPVGILPLGKSNTIGKNLFPGGSSLQKVRSLADASLAIIEKRTKPIDIMKIEVLDDPESEGKPVYAVSSVEWGAYRDAQAKKDKYWFLGPLRSYATYLFNGYKDNLTWNCKANINYTLPCRGCKNCVSTSNTEPSWFQRVIFRFKGSDDIKCVNDKCKDVYEKTISTSDMALFTMNNMNSSIGDEMPKLKLSLGPDSVDYFNFVRQGWRTESGQDRNISESIEAKELEIKPFNISSDSDEKWFSIDKENFEVRPVKITLLPKAIKMFCKQNPKHHLIV